MSEKIEHRQIDPHQCPRCGGFNTSSTGRDGTPTETFLCHDCTKVNEDLDCYDVVRSEAVESVNWTDADDEYRTIYDTEYLAKAEAANLLHIAEQLVLWEQDPDGYGGDLADLARQAQEIVNRAKGKPHE